MCLYQIQHNDYLIVLINNMCSYYTAYKSNKELMFFNIGQTSLNLAWIFPI